MKRITMIFLLLLAIIYLIETSGTVGFSNYKPVIDIEHSNNKYTLTWSKMPYLAYYEVEVLNHIIEKDPPTSPMVPSYRIVKYRTFSNSMTIDQDFPESA